MHTKLSRPNQLNQNEFGTSTARQGRAMGNPALQAQASEAGAVDDRRSEAALQHHLRAMADSSPQVASLGVLQAMAMSSADPAEKDHDGEEHAAQRQVAPNGNSQAVQQHTGVIQRVATVTIKNTTNAYDSGWVQSESYSAGVDSGPQAEAQKVASIVGGTWVGGHMVNDRLGGTGGFENIVPITGSMNNQHHRVENAAQQKLVENGSIYEVRYYMNILNRNNYNVAPNNDKINNLPDSFQQSFDYRTKAVSAGGTSSRPIAAQPAGPIVTITGSVLNMTV